MSDIISRRARKILFLVLGVIALLALFVQPVAAAPGDLDTTFGTGGKVTTAIGNSSDNGRSVVIQPDGKIIVAGYSYNSGYDFALVRYNTNGSLDTSFSGTGKVTTAIGTGDDFGKSVAMQPDGKIIVVGYSRIGSNYDFEVARYHSNGGLDTSFNVTGKVITDIGISTEGPLSVAIQPDGKIIVAGYSNHSIALVRYHANGSLDTSFNGTGKVTTAGAGGLVAIQPDGKIIVAGAFSNGNNSDFALLRYNTNGSLDTSFNGTGMVTTAIGSGTDASTSVALQSDGKIVVAGWSSNGSNEDFALVRYTGSGALDSSFGSGGKVTTPIGANDDRGYSVTVQSDGKIAVAGYSFNGSNYDFALVRYTAGGALDPSFGSGGRVTTAIGNSTDFCYSVAIQLDGRIIVAGVSWNGSNDDFALVRYLGDSVISPVITAQPQSQIVLAGQSTTFAVQVTANPAPTYQWRRFGIDIPGATSATLTLNNVQVADAANYSVVVRNSAGPEVTSTAAKLTVLSNLDIAAPGLTSYSFPQAPAGTDSLVLITHGRIDPEEPEDSPSSAWIEAMKSKIQGAGLPSNWAVLTYHWEDDATTSKLQLADGLLLALAYKHGAHVGNELILQGLSRPGGKWQHIHFIAHSAGSGLIETASRIVKAGVSQSAPTIHTTFLDPFTGTRDGNRTFYGGNSNWSDNYFSFSPDTWDDKTFFGQRTYGPMAHSHNVDVTWLDPDLGEEIEIHAASQYSPNSTPATLLPASIFRYSTHGWPIEFYQNTIPPIAPDRPAAHGNYGFPLSKEAGGSANDASHPRPNSPIPKPGGPSGITEISTGTTPVTIDTTTAFSTIPYARSQTGTIQVNATGFTAITSAPLPSPAPPEEANTSNQPPVAAPPPPVGAPAWISIPVDVTGTVSFVTFNAEFTSQPGANGLLTVYWNDVEIGRIEEQVALSGMQSYTFDVPSVFFDRNNSLGFRLDQFSGVQSSISVSNVATGFGGLPTAPKLKIETVTGIPTPVLTVTGTQNFTYLIETSPDLVNWEPMAAVTLDTGMNAALTDPDATGLQLRFYRAVSP